MNLPPRLPESGKWGALFAWLNQLRDVVDSFKPLPSHNVRVTRTRVGTGLLGVAAAESEPASPAVSVERFRLKSMGTNVLVCRTWDGTSEGDTDTFVAKPTKLQPRIAYERIDGVLWTYTYPSNTERVASATGQPDEQQNIVPRYLVPATYTGPGPGFPTVVYPGDEIFAAQFEDALFVADGVTPVYYQDLNVDGRAWAKVYGT